MLERVELEVGSKETKSSFITMIRSSFFVFSVFSTFVFSVFSTGLFPSEEGAPLLPQATSDSSIERANNNVTILFIVPIPFFVYSQWDI